MKNSYKIIFGSIILLILIIIVVLVVGSRGAGPEINLTDINFTELGYISDKEPTKLNKGLYLIYEEPGKPGLSVKLQFDKASICTFSEQSVPCLTLSNSISNTTNNKRVFVEGIKQDEVVLIKNIAIDKEFGRKFGFIRSVTENDQNVLIGIDEVEFLSGEAAILAGIKDTGCARAKIFDCIPSLNNDFYIRNTDLSLQTFTADLNTDISVFKNPGSPVLEKVGLETFVKKYNDQQSRLNSYPFKFVPDGGSLSELEEQYTP